MSFFSKYLILMFSLALFVALFFGFDLLLSFDSPAVDELMSNPQAHLTPVFIWLLAVFLVIGFITLGAFHYKKQINKSDGFFGFNARTLLVICSLALVSVTLKTVPGLTSAEEFVNLQKKKHAKKFCSSSGYKVCVETQFCEKVTEESFTKCAKSIGVWGTIRPQLAAKIEARLKKCALLSAYDQVRRDRGYRRCLDSHSY